MSEKIRKILRLSKYKNVKRRRQVRQAREFAPVTPVSAVDGKKLGYAERADSDMLTPREIDELRRSAKVADAYFAEHFQNRKGEALGSDPRTQRLIERGDYLGPLEHPFDHPLSDAEMAELLRGAQDLENTEDLDGEIYPAGEEIVGTGRVPRPYSTYTSPAPYRAFRLIRGSLWQAPIKKKGN